MSTEVRRLRVGARRPRRSRVTSRSSVRSSWRRRGRARESAAAKLRLPSRSRALERPRIVRCHSDGTAEGRGGVRPERRPCLARVHRGVVREPGRRGGRRRSRRGSDPAPVSFEDHVAKLSVRVDRTVQSRAGSVPIRIPSRPRSNPHPNPTTDLTRWRRELRPDMSITAADALLPAARGGPARLAELLRTTRVLRFDREVRRLLATGAPKMEIEKVESLGRMTSSVRSKPEHGVVSRSAPPSSRDLWLVENYPAKARGESHPVFALDLVQDLARSSRRPRPRNPASRSPRRRSRGLRRSADDTRKETRARFTHVRSLLGGRASARNSSDMSRRFHRSGPRPHSQRRKISPPEWSRGAVRPPMDESNVKPYRSAPASARCSISGRLALGGVHRS